MLITIMQKYIHILHMRGHLIHRALAYELSFLNSHAYHEILEYAESGSIKKYRT